MLRHRRTELPAQRVGALDARPIAVHPDVGPTAPVGLKIAVRVAPDAARHGRPGLRAHELADLAPWDRLPLGSPHVDGHPERRPAKGARLQLGDREWGEEA